MGEYFRRRFWGIAGNEHYSVGCTGQTVCLCDASGAELAVCKDLKYAYTPMFSPKGDPFIVKSTGGWLAVYSLDPPRLVKKFKFSPPGAVQDEGCRSNGSTKKITAIYRHTNV